MLRRPDFFDAPDTALVGIERVFRCDASIRHHCRIRAEHAEFIAYDAVIAPKRRRSERSVLKLLALLDDIGGIIRAAVSGIGIAYFILFRPRNHVVPPSDLIEILNTRIGHPRAGLIVFVYGGISVRMRNRGQNMIGNISRASALHAVSELQIHIGIGKRGRLIPTAGNIRRTDNGTAPVAARHGGGASRPAHGNPASEIVAYSDKASKRIIFIQNFVAETVFFPDA